MKILAIGDPHGWDRYKKSIFNGIDLILIPGDIGKADIARKRYFENFERKKKNLPELEKNSKFVRAAHMEIHTSTIKILQTFSKFAPTYTIQGNVGILGKNQVKEDWEEYRIRIPITRKIIDNMKNVYLVKNGIRIINGLRVGFLEYFVDTNWVIDFKPSNYKKELKKAKEKTNKAQKILKRFGKIDILICHQPPYGILDKVTWGGAPRAWQGKHAGSKLILNYIKKYQPKLVLCGHIHEAKGQAKIGKTTIYNLGVSGDYKILKI